MSFDRNQSNFKKIISLLQNPQIRVIPFVGAGLSIYGKHHHRLPQWCELLSILKQRALDMGLMAKSQSPYVNNLIKEKKLIAAADIIVNTLGEAQFRLIVQDIFDIQNKPIPPAVLEMVCISWSLMVTTNLDRFIETAWAKKQSSSLQVITGKEPTDLVNCVLGNVVSPTILKTHGTIERCDSWVLTNTHYDQLLFNNPSYEHALKILYSQTLLFIGYGLTDRDFEPILAQLKKLFPGGIGRSFALLNENQKGLAHINFLIKEYGVQPIWYNVDRSRINTEDCGYGEILECIQFLVRTWISGQRTVPITLKAFPELDPNFVGRDNELNKLSELVFDKGITSIQIIGFGGEGKTSLVQQWIKNNENKFASSYFEHVFGCSFYKADVGRFIEYAHALFCPREKSLDIKRKVTRLRKSLFNKSVVIILDGLEVIQDAEGNITNPYLRDIIESAIMGNSVVLITSRVPVNNGFTSIFLGQLNEDDAVNILKEWNIPGTDDELKYAIRNHIGRHALSVRILAGFFKTENLDHLHQIQNLDPVRNLPDEADPLRANKVARVLEFYQKFLSKDAIAFMKAFSIFNRPVSESTVIEIFHEDLGEDSVTFQLSNVNLSRLITELKNKRLLLAEYGTELVCHPLVRECFKNQTSIAEARPLHKRLLNHYLSLSEEQYPKTIEEAIPLFQACYHAAKSELWDSYHKTFGTFLNRGIKYYLGYVIGAWEEFLALAKLVFPNEDISNFPEFEPAYYHGAIALSMKRLGYSKEAVTHYVHSIHEYIKTNPIESARQINNLLITNVSIGNLQYGANLIQINIAAINWISDKNAKLWQLEAALTTFGKLASRVGNFKFAKSYFNMAKNIRSKDDLIARNLYDIQRIGYSDFLIADGEIEEAIQVAKDNLQITQQGKWKDAISSALRACSTVYRAYARLNPNSINNLSEARDYLNDAFTIAEDIYQPELEIELKLEQLRLNIDFYDRSIISLETLNSQCLNIFNRLESLIEHTNLRLYEPECKALKGQILYYQGKISESHILVQTAKNIACLNGDILVLTHEGYNLTQTLKKLDITIEKPTEIILPNPEHLLSTSAGKEDVMKKIMKYYEMYKNQFE
ncbi:MAG: SIR2 family protein [candidate division Zixibacteria bacterium]|nr:SIR2 family protein [candidate division Zixibacteria bacterium]